MRRSQNCGFCAAYLTGVESVVFFFSPLCNRPLVQGNIGYFPSTVATHCSKYLQKIITRGQVNEDDYLQEALIPI